MIKLLRAAWERLSVYLPILLMGVLALGTYWLVRSTPVFAPPEAEKPLRHEPDYFMQKFSVKSFDGAGRLKSEVFGVEIRHYPDTDTLEIDQVRIRSFNEQGRLTTATANRALTNGDAAEVQLFGNALVVREAAVDKTGESIPRMTYRGEFLHAFMNTELVKSHKPVELTRGNDQFTAESMDYDNIDQVMQLRGRVRGTLVPGNAK
ncbi:MAG: LPS export ABC transporter periplasmic protein LptC [Bacteroidota bacterium]|nr:LPS export ABC transporter periplasmic protein LptC [Bacteroidota bacterium]